MLNVIEIPGYMEAVAQEQLVRDAAFLGINESIAGFEVSPLTLRHYLALRILRHPLLCKEACTPTGLKNFLWLIHPKYTPGRSLARLLFNRRCRAFMPPRYGALLNTRRAQFRHAVKCRKRAMFFEKVLAAALEYIEEAFQDRPASRNSHGYQEDYYSDGAAFCGFFGREFGWAPAVVMEMPMKQILQFVNEMKESSRASGSRIPLCNPSDRVKARWLNLMARQRKAAQ